MVDNKGESIGNLELDIKVAEQIMERANGDPIPQYSNDIVAAMQVVEKLRERHHFHVPWYPAVDGRQQWTVPERFHLSKQRIKCDRNSCLSRRSWTSARSIVEFLLTDQF